MFFSSRVPADLHRNRLSLIVESLARQGTPIADLTESNPTRVGLPYPPDLIAGLSAPENLIYEPQPFGLDVAREAVAHDFARRGLEVPADRVVLTASTSEAYSILFKLLCDPGDRVLVPVPSYPLFEYLTRLDAIEAVPYPLHFEGRWTVDLEAARHAVTRRTRAILVVNPNNPTGSFVSAGDLAGLRGLCREHGMALIGDEVFADYAVDDARVTSVLEGHDVLTFGLGGLSKAAALPQLKLGWIGITGPAVEVSSSLARLEVICDAYLSVATPVQRAAPQLLASAASLRSAILQRLRRNLSTLEQLASAHPAVDVLPCEGGWYAVIRVPRIMSEDELVSLLIEEEHVLVHPGYFFDFPHEAFLVVSLLPATDVFEPAIRRVLSRAS
jgi:aspartate/methionine/tyrosine aminotransferase